MNLTEFVSQLQDASCVPDDFALPDATNACVEEEATDGLRGKIQKFKCIATSLGIIPEDGSAVNDPITLPSTVTGQQEVFDACRTDVTSTITSLPDRAQGRATLSEVQGVKILKCWMMLLKECLKQGSTGTDTGTPETD